MGGPLKPQAITEPAAILVEGNDDEEFVRAFLIYERIQQVQILNAGGKSVFPDALRTAPMITGFSGVRKFGVIQDADGNSSAAFQSVSALLTNAGLVAPSNTMALSNGNPQIAIFVFPANGSNGMLEDLCLNSVSGHPAMNCVTAFDACTSSLNPPPSNRAKSKAQSFLAAMRDSVPNVGIAAKKGYWNFASPAMDDCRTFLRLFR